MEVKRSREIVREGLGGPLKAVCWVQALVYGGDWMKGYERDVGYVLDEGGVPVLVYAGTEDFICNCKCNFNFNFELNLASLIEQGDWLRALQHSRGHNPSSWDRLTGSVQQRSHVSCFDGAWVGRGNYAWTRALRWSGAHHFNSVRHTYHRHIS